MSLLINQPAGLGDIFFIQKIISVLADETDVYHPIHDAFWDSGANRVITKAQPRHITVDPAAQVVNLDQSLPLLGMPNTELMKSKYYLVGIDYADWKDYFKYTRDHDAEAALKDRLSFNEPFILVNQYFGPPHDRHAIREVYDFVPDDYDGRIIEMDAVHASNIFDWCWLLENAEEIHTVDGSIMYILETLDVKADYLVAHPRHFDYSEALYDGILGLDWHWVTYLEDKRVRAPL